MIMYMYMYFYFMKRILNDKILVIFIVFNLFFLIFVLVGYFEFKNILYLIF